MSVPASSSSSSSSSSFSGQRYKPRTGYYPRSGQPSLERKRESIFDLGKFINSSVVVKFMGGREVIGVLRGFDKLANLVLEDCVENIIEPGSGSSGIDLDLSAPKQRKLGVVVARGPTVTAISPAQGSCEIPNPFLEMALDNLENAE